MLLITQTRRTIGIGARDGLNTERVNPVPQVGLPRVKTSSLYQFKPGSPKPDTNLYSWRR